MGFRVNEEEDGNRVDRVVAAHSELSRADVKQLFEAGGVRVNGKRVKRGVRVEAGDEVELSESAPLSSEALPDPDVPVDVRYEDQALLIVQKPAGMPSHPLRAGEKGCLANGLLARFPELAGVGYEPRQPGLVNRLDNDTSGLLLVARRPEVFDALREGLAAGMIRKRYIAATDQLPNAATLQWAIGPHPTNPKRVITAADDIEGDTVLRPALSHVIREQDGPSGVYVTVEAHRAQRHQVRAHLAAAGAPICGDVLYGGRALACGQHLLHASEVLFPHPLTAKPVEVVIGMPTDWAQLRAE